MSLGSNRDYKTTDRRARNNLRKHYDLMQNMVARGVPHNIASKIALLKLEGKECNLCQDKEICWCLCEVRP